MKIAVAQLNLWVGDLDGNAAKIVAAAAHAREGLGAQLLLTPELSLLGYPPDDLLLRAALPAAIAAGLERIRLASGGIHVVVGHPEFTAAGVYNAASVFRDGALVARARKQLLPNYGVFDEKRHFVAHPGPTTVFDLDGQRLALCICEDVWGPEPAATAKAAGAGLLLNINASPYNVGKPAERLAVLRTRAAESGLPIVYVNCVGGQDELVFDGDSMAIAADGSVGFRAPQFEEAVLPVEVDFARGSVRGGLRAGHDAATPAGGASDEVSAEVSAEVYAALVQATRDYVDRNRFPGALVGLSGGIDSALVAAIAADAIGPGRVWAVSLPSRYTLDMSNDDARAQAAVLGIRHSVLPIEPAFTAFTETLGAEFAGRPVDLAEENIQSRCRGVLLMALSNKFGHMVLTTGNKSEMAVGYATLYGDMCGGFAPIKDAYKTLVYALARYRNSLGEVIPPRVIERPPSAELRADQKDSDSLPPYEVLDPILEAYVERGLSIPQIAALGFDAEIVKRVAGLVRRSEYKRRQAPPGPKITPRAFGRERRYPITAVYGDL